MNAILRELQTMALPPLPRVSKPPTVSPTVTASPTMASAPSAAPIINCDAIVVTKKCACPNFLHRHDNESIRDAVDKFFSDREMAEATYGPIKCWNVVDVTDMSYLFSFQSSFDEDLSCWNVGNVEDMTWMFKDAYNFNGDVSTWNVKRVNDMKWMFWGARKFNIDLNSWEVDNVQSMDFMFQDTSNFDHKLTWDVSRKGTNRMFQRSKGCISSSCCPDCDEDDVMIC